MITAATVAKMMCQPNSRLNTQAMIAPNVTISPWAKLDNPVVP